VSTSYPHFKILRQYATIVLKRPCELSVHAGNLPLASKIESAGMDVTTPITSTAQISPIATAVSVVTQQQVDTLRDPIWQFVGAVLALAAIFLSVLFFIWQRNKKELRYSVIYQTSLFSVDKGIEDRLKVYLHNSLVTSLDLIVLRVYNSGNTPILTSDYDQPIQFRFGDNAQVYAAEISETNPKGIPVTPDKGVNEVTLIPFLMNKKDSIVLKVWVVGYDGNVDISGRVSGIKEIYGPGNTKSLSYVGKDLISLMLHVVTISAISGAGAELLIAGAIGFLRLLAMALISLPFLLLGALFFPNGELKLRKFGLGNLILLLLAIAFYIMVGRQ
jgi:hypothetical protein